MPSRIQQPMLALLILSLAIAADIDVCRAQEWDTSPGVEAAVQLHPKQLVGGTLRYSNNGPQDGTLIDPYDAFRPAVAYDSIHDRFLLVWEADHNQDGQVNDEFEIFGRIINGDGAPFLNTFRISAGPGDLGNASFDQVMPDVVYNPGRLEYLVVWSGSRFDFQIGAINSIFGQRVNAITGNLVGDRELLSINDAFNPAVAYNSVRNEYLVVFEGDNQFVAGQELEIYGQRLHGSTLQTLQGNFLISDGNGTGDDFDQQDPDVAYNPTDDDYLVVWSGDRSETIANLPFQVDNEFEIMAARVTGNGSVGGNLQMSDNGPLIGGGSFDAFDPAVTHNGALNEYLVVWSANDDGTIAPGMTVNEFEIFAQRWGPARVLPEIGEEMRISEMGPSGNPFFQARDPAVSYDSLSSDYLVVWEGVIPVGRTDIYARPLGLTGTPIGPAEKVNTVNPNGDPDFDQFNPAVAFDPNTRHHLVVWEGDYPVPPIALNRQSDDEFEILGQRVLAPLFADGFESGDVSAWTLAVP